MKIRTGFVTNSSSSSYLLIRKSEPAKQFDFVNKKYVAHLGYGVEGENLAIIDEPMLNIIRESEKTWVHIYEAQALIYLEDDISVGFLKQTLSEISDDLVVVYVERDNNYSSNVTELADWLGD